MHLRDGKPETQMPEVIQNWSWVSADVPAQWQARDTNARGEPKLVFLNDYRETGFQRHLLINRRAFGQCSEMRLVICVASRLLEGVPCLTALK